MPRFQILPAEMRFHDWFEKGSRTLLDGAHALKELLDHYEAPANKVAEITETEHQGDFIVHEIRDLLLHTLIPPLDNEDIQALSHTVDDALDGIEQAAVKMLIYRIEQPTPEARELGDLIVRCAVEIDSAMPLLREKSLLQGVRRHAIEVNRLENEADAVLRRALEKLVATSRNDWFEFSRWKEIYEELEDVTDRFEDIADVLQTVVLKNA